MVKHFESNYFLEYELLQDLYEFKEPNKTQLEGELIISMFSFESF